MCVYVCVSLHELFIRKLKNFSPVDTEQRRASVLTSALIQKESRQDFFLSYGSTAAIHGEGRIGFPALKSLSSLFYSRVSSPFLPSEAQELTRLTNKMCKTQISALEATSWM